MANLVLYLWISEARETRSWSAGGVFFYCIVIYAQGNQFFNLKMFSSLRISNRVKCCIISFVCNEDAVKAVIWLILIFLNFVWHAVPQLIDQ